MNVFSAGVWVPKGRLHSLFEQDGVKENIFCFAQIRNVLFMARLYYTLIPLRKKAKYGKFPCENRNGYKSP